MKLSCQNNLVNIGNTKKMSNNISFKSSDKLKIAQNIPVAKKITKKAGIVAAYLLFCNVVAVGRNPAKAAKVLTGTSDIVDDTYEVANKIVDDLFENNSTFKKEFHELVTSLTTNTKQDKTKEMFYNLHKLIKNTKDVPDDVRSAFNDFVKNYNEFFKVSSKTSAKGDKVDIDTLLKLNDKNMDNVFKLRSFIRDLPWEVRLQDDVKRTWDQILDFDFFNQSPDGIIDCPKKFLTKDNVYYHGTTSYSKIYKNGFSPYVSKQLSTGSRELGAGIYFSPDLGVSAGFSGKYGDIIPVKLDDDAKIAFVSDDAHSNIFNEIYRILGNTLGNDRINNMQQKEKNALVEVLIRKVFIDSGYDAAYTPKGYIAGLNLFGGNINDMLGRNQSQLVVFAPEKIKIQSRNLKERISDLKVKNDTLKSEFLYLKNKLNIGNK